MATRDELAAALAEGNSVEVAGRRVTRLRDLPHDPEDGPPVEGVVMYSGGKLTRAGMEHTIRSGGSVLIHGGGPLDHDEVVTRVEDLPEEAELAAGDERRLAAHKDAIDAQLEKLTAERARVNAAAEKAREARANAPAAGAEQHHAAHGHGHPHAAAHPHAPGKQAPGKK
jgi:hypothetical protein